MDTRQKIHSLVTELLCNKGYTEAFSDSENLLSSGHLDSVDVMDIVVYLEKEFELDFAERGIDQNDFDSVNSILDLITELS